MARHSTFTEDTNLHDDLVAEEIPSLVDFADDISQGAWPTGWYPAIVIEGYQSKKGKQFLTEDAPSKQGDSRNLTMALKLSNVKGEERNIQDSTNYRVTDFTPERLAFVKEARTEYKGVKGRWPNADVQRSSLAIAALGAIERAFGFGFRRTPNGALVTAPFVGHRVDVRLKTNEKGFNEVAELAPSGTKTRKS